jgi:uncharacterized protein
VELPYTLPQDSTMFLLLRETDTKIWEQKSEWIMQHGGMILMNVHPDYLNFNGTNGPLTYSASLYEGFLNWMSERFGQDLWHTLPSGVARLIVNHREEQPETTRDKIVHVSTTQSGPGIKIWIDMENTPHIPFFLPIIRELQQQGHEVVITARDGYQTCEMARYHSLKFHRIGRHYGKNLLAKIAGLLIRSSQLAKFGRREKPMLALNLGSRSQNLSAKILGIPTVEIMDYEHTAESPLLEPQWYIKPDIVHNQGSEQKSHHKTHTYQGIKEDVYIPDFKPDESILDELGLRGANTIVTIRPSATEAHYHNPESELLFIRLIDRLLGIANIKAVVLPRNSRQESSFRTEHPEWFECSRVIIPRKVVNGLNLIWHSDLVVSGGGTMNREAAAMGVPVYSIFRGKIGAVDRHLCHQQRLVMIETPHDVDHKIRIEPRQRIHLPDSTKSRALIDILHHLNHIIASLRPDAVKAAA